MGKKVREHTTKEQIEELNHAILQTVLAGVIVIDADTRKIVHINNVALKKIGLEEEKVIGRVCHKFICPSEKKNCPILDHGKAVDFSEKILLTAHGERRNIIKTVSPVNLRSQTYLIESFIDITELKQAEEALRESERSIKHKLNTLLSPDADIANLELSDIIDCETIQKLMDKFHTLTNIGMAIIDLNGKVLVGTGWQDICTKFHRVHPESCKLCIESDIELSRDVPVGTFKMYRCRNNMWDMASPIKLGGTLMGNFFLGQFFFDDEIPDYENFRKQALKYGFDEESYLAALDRVPRWSREKVDAVMSFYTLFAEMISSLSYANVKLASTLEERKKAEDALIESEEKYRSVIESAPDSIFIIKNGLVIFANHRLLEISGFSEQEIIGKPFLNFITENDRETVKHYYERRLKGEPCPTNYESSAVLKNGTILPVNITISTFKLAGENVELVFCHDITERKMIEDKIKQLNVELEQRVAERTEELEHININLQKEISIRMAAEELITQQLQEKEILMKEIHHRVKNNMQVIISILNLQTAFTKSKKIASIMQDSQSRIKTMALIHEKLYQSKNLAFIDLSDYLENLCNYLFSSYTTGEIPVKYFIDAEKLTLDIDTTISLGLITNELLTNSLKYAFSKEKAGHINIVFKKLDHDHLLFSVSDNGKGFPENFDYRQSKSLGLQLVCIISEQIGGELKVESTARGTSFTITFPSVN